MADGIQDSFGREFVYLRLSVTERCNFRCVYCLPKGYTAAGGAPRNGELSVAEVARLVRALAKAGVWKVRLTGGEPTVRPDIVELVRAVAATAGVRRVALTTNGYRLRSLAAPLAAAGLSALNVSVDSLSRSRFADITGKDLLPRVLVGIDQALAVGISSVKINTVLLGGTGSDDVHSFIAFARDRPVEVRFIELMRTGENEAFFARHHVRGTETIATLVDRGWRERAREPGAGPARVFEHADFLGTVGIIAPYDDSFCASCNRIRVSARGAVRLCLFGSGEASVRALLTDDADADVLVRRVRSLVGGKADRHGLHEGRVGGTRHLALIGG